jgi:glycerate kinase
LLADRFGVDPDLSGAGAAGGVGIALAATLGATIEPGFDVVASLLGLDAAIGERDLVITSEGRLDRQSLMGKVIGGVLDRAERHGVPVIAVPGAVEADLPDGIRRRFAAIRSLEETVGPDLARHRTLDALRQTASAAMRDLFR